MARRPVIGLTLDSEEPGGYSALPWYALRRNYFASVTRAGGLPLGLPHEPDLAEAYLDLLDGLIVTGGAFDIDPALFGASERHPSVTTKEQRTAFEWAAAGLAVKRDLPILGICGGAQLLNVVFGGSLLQHIPDRVENHLPHEQPGPRDRPGHAVKVQPGTRLERICGAGELQVNSAHHQAVERPGGGLVVNALAPDGVIEGIEQPDMNFCIGVQWHPEYEISAADHALFYAFVEAARG